MNVGKAIRKLRNKKGVTLSQMSKATGCDIPYLSRLENNISDLSKSKHLHAICDYFGVSLPIVYLQSLEITDAPIENQEEARIVLENLNETYLRIFTHKPGENPVDLDTKGKKVKIKIKKPKRR
jgi:transcriptional regulator with XRE-family HTH domain